MPKVHSKFVCQQCGYESAKWMGRCPDCEQWNSFVEEIEEPPSKFEVKAPRGGVASRPVRLEEVSASPAQRTPTGIMEFDRVLGGGIVPGSLILIGGDPGIGKSTLLTQVANLLSLGSSRVLYISGEESVEQIKLRANRIGLTSSELFLLAESDIQAAIQHINEAKPNFVVIDSIQTMFDPELTSAAGTVSQVKACTAALARIAKSSGMPIFLVGHVTKEGAIAGPRVLEHMVDTVLYFEGDRHHAYRILRAVKNRFGSTDELGIFEMREDGLAEVGNPSEVFLSERPRHGAGSVVTCTMEGTRPILVEIQALVAPSHFTMVRRMCTGLDYNRSMMLLAVLEKRAGIRLGGQDTYLNVAGGVRINEPAADLAIAVAVASGLKEVPLDGGTVVIGEVGLAGEVRAVSRLEKRLREAARLGFTKAVVPSSLRGSKSFKIGGLEQVGVDTLAKAIQICLGGE